MRFTIEMYQSPGHATRVVSHKPVAVEAGLGHMGIHRNPIHPRFGIFKLLGTVLMECEATDYDHPIDYNPCLECKRSRLSRLRDRAGRLVQFPPSRPASSSTTPADREYAARAGQARIGQGEDGCGDALTEEGEAGGYILASRAKIRGDVRVEA